MTGTENLTVVAATKRYVSDERHRLRLFETVGEDVRRVKLLRDDRFSLTTRWSQDGFRRRVPDPGDVCADLCRVKILLAAWGGESARNTVTLPIRRLSDEFEVRSRDTGWRYGGIRYWRSSMQAVWPPSMQAASVGYVRRLFAPDATDPRTNRYN